MHQRHLSMPAFYTGNFGRRKRRARLTEIFHGQLAGSAASLLSTTSSSISSSLVCPACASQPTQAIAGAPASSTATPGAFNIHRRLRISWATFSICRHYGESRGRCNDPRCPDLHVCRAWLAGYDRFLICPANQC